MNFSIFHIYFCANLNYDISMKGKYVMTQREQIKNLILANDGMIQTSQVLDMGISKTVLYQYVKENNMEQISHGVYATKDAWKDAMYLLHLRCEQAVFSHETALYLHDLAEREPMEYEITVKTGYNPSKLRSDGIKVYTVKKELLDVGKRTVKSNQGNEIPMYDLERTICDLVRSRSSIEIQDFNAVLKAYVGRKDKDLNKLMKYAKLFRVDKIIRNYMEVLL